MDYDNMKVPGDKPHRRYNPLSGEWLLVSSHRVNRPWKGQEEPTEQEDQLEFDPNCYLCPGNRRVNDKQNPKYDGTFVFNNDFPALLPGDNEYEIFGSDILRKWQPVAGTSRVICYSPRHDLTLPELSVREVIAVIKTWIEQSRDLSEKYEWVQIFENKGKVMGTSNSHPHGQIWASNFIPTEVLKEDYNQLEYFGSKKSPLLYDYTNNEIDAGERIVTMNNSWVALVPFWAKWPFETIIVPQGEVTQIVQLDEDQIGDLALLLKSLLTKYDKLFGIPFPYSMGWHGAPYHAGKKEHWTLHAHIYPPLLRSSTIKKFMVGYEMLAEAQRDLTPESAAQKLASLSDKY